MKVTILLNKSIHGDGRVQRQLGTLRHAGWNTILLSRDTVDYHLPKIGFYLNLIYTAVWLKPDAVHCNDVTTLLPGCFIKILTGCRLVFDAHEYFPRSRGVDGTWRGEVWSLLEKILMPCVDRVVTVNRFIADKYNQTHDLDRPAVVVMNKPRVNLPATPRNLNPDEIKLVYVGNTGGGRGIPHMLELIQRLPGNYSLTFIGSGCLDGFIHNQIKEHGLQDRVFHRGHIPYHQLYREVKRYDVGLCLIEDWCWSYYYSTPNKLFEYLACGLPVLASTVPSLMEWVEARNYGRNINLDGDVFEWINVLMCLIDCYQEIQDEIVEGGGVFCFDCESGKLVDVYNEFNEVFLE